MIRGAILALLFGAMGFNDAMPPQTYWREAQATVFFLTPANVQEVCSGATGINNAILYACANQTGRGAGVVVLPDPCPFGAVGERFAELACHEKAHLHGWRHL